MTQWEIYEALQNLPQPATKKAIMEELKRLHPHGAPNRWRTEYSLRRLVANRLVAINFKGKLTTYAIIAPFPERTVVVLKI